MNAKITLKTAIHWQLQQYTGKLDTTCVPRPSPTEPHSGPPLTNKPGPAKQTTPERGTVQNTQCGYTFRK